MLTVLCGGITLSSARVCTDIPQSKATPQMA